MAVIDQAAVLVDVKLYLPDANVLSDAELSNIIAFVVTNQIPADDEIYTAEATCKSLRNAALVNLSLYSVDTAGKKREKVGKVEVEYFDGTSKEAWSRYLDSLRDLCPLVLGYTLESTTNNMSIAPGEQFLISPCGRTDLCDPDRPNESIYGTEWCNPLRDDNNDPFQDPFQ